MFFSDLNPLYLFDHGHETVFIKKMPNSILYILFKNLNNYLLSMWLIYSTNLLFMGILLNRDYRFSYKY